jgi:hypothetical protein
MVGIEHSPTAIFDVSRAIQSIILTAWAQADSSATLPIPVSDREME